MIKIFAAIDEITKPIDHMVEGCYIQVIAPTESDIKQLESLGVLPDFIKYALDEEEISRIEVDNQQVLLMLDIPISPRSTDNHIHSTIPMAFIVLPNHLISLCTRENSLFADVTKMPHITTAYKTRFVLQFLGKTASKYMLFLKEMDRITDAIEERAVKSIKNKEVMELMKIQKSLVFLTTSLRANEATLERIRQGKVLPL